MVRFLEILLNFYQECADTTQELFDHFLTNWHLLKIQNRIEKSFNEVNKELTALKIDLGRLHNLGMQELLDLQSLSSSENFDSTFEYQAHKQEQETLQQQLNSYQEQINLINRVYLSLVSQVPSLIEDRHLIQDKTSQNLLDDL